MNLTTHILTQNNDKTLEFCLESLAAIDCQILVGDLGSDDNTLEICRKFRAKVIRLHSKDNQAKARNSLLKESKTDWNFYIEPWESLLSGEMELGNPDAYRVSCIKGDVITKPIRLWHKNLGLQFKNPVFEYLDYEAKNIPVYLAVSDSKIRKDLIESWAAKQPLSPEPIYYSACEKLISREWDDFLNLADLFLHRAKKAELPIAMTNYYCSMVNCYIKKDSSAAIKHILPCLANRPTMAEFWCLLGDIYYDKRQYKKAKEFYENGFILGSQRVDDEWPMEISKYKEYPLKMMNACSNILKSATFYTH